jgi:3-methyladenine DNA glycosylase/8-oxoguanine DNA glycosylase
MVKSRFDFDPTAAVAHLRAQDEILGVLMDRVGPFAPEPRPIDNLFTALSRTIIYQQLHGNAAAAIYDRMLVELKKYGGLKPEALLKAPEAALRQAGLSANKLASLRDLALKSQEGIVPTLKEAHKMSDAELIERLTQVRGIGTWTVHMLLIFTLGRPDVLPTGDFSIRLGFKKLYRKRKDPKPDAIMKHARKWQPYRSDASWYLYRLHDLE